jgi:hypothetical protein
MYIGNITSSLLPALCSSASHFTSARDPLQCTLHSLWRALHDLSSSHNFSRICLANNGYTSSQHLLERQRDKGAILIEPLRKRPLDLHAVLHTSLPEVDMHIVQRHKLLHLCGDFNSLAVGTGSHVDLALLYTPDPERERAIDQCVEGDGDGGPVLGGFETELVVPVEAGGADEEGTVA